MTDLRQAAQMALAAWDSPMGMKELCVAMDTFRAALEQLAEPVGEVIDERGEVDYISYVPPVGTALYTTPPQRKPLTDERILHLVETHVGGPSPSYPLDNSDWINFTRAIEKAHNIKG